MLKRSRRPLHGVLLLDKPSGWSSHDALQKVKNLLRAEKAGHTGTLDPLATGLLPLCFGAATKFSQISLDADKTYRATLRLGQVTTTGDAEGEVSAVRPVQVTEAALAAVCQSMLGCIEQVPPMYSALKHAGRPLYEYARAGIELERAPRQVQIHHLAIIRWQATELEIEVCCSKGTYIRTLAEDLGERLGCGAHLIALQRLASGPLKLADAISIETLMSLDTTAQDQRLLSPDVLVADWPRVDLNAEDAGRFLTGLRRRVELPNQAGVRVYGPQPKAFLGTARICAQELIPIRLLSPLEVQTLE